MKQVSEMPTNGQFVAVWMFNNLVYSATLKWIDEKLYGYSCNNGIDDGFTAQANRDFYLMFDAQYFIAD